MSSEYAAPSDVAGPQPHERSRRALRIFLAASFAVHAVVIIGLPDFLPGFPAPRTSVLEVTILAPEPLAMTADQPEPRAAASQPVLAPQPPRAGQRKPPADLTKPAQGSQSPAASVPQREAEMTGSIAVAPPGSAGPAAAAPAPATEPAASPATPPSFDAAYLSNPAPRYPQAARRAGEQGTVTLRVMVKRDGLPARVEVEKSSGSRHLDAAAQDAVRGWRFAPARQGSEPIESWVLVPVVFRLESAL